MSSLILSFDWDRVIVQPWLKDSPTIWIVLMGFLVTAACGLVGDFLLLRRMALIGDAISHSILPGLVVAFMIFKTAATWVAFVGALAAGIVTGTHHRIHSPAIPCQTRCRHLHRLHDALCHSESCSSACSKAQGSFHIDADCVLYGEIAFVPLEPPVVWNGYELGPPSALRMGFVFTDGDLGPFRSSIRNCLSLLSTRDLLKSLGMRIGLWHYGLMGALALVIVSAFESVGAILAVAMLIVPAMFAAELSEAAARCGS